MVLDLLNPEYNIGEYDTVPVVSVVITTYNRPACLAHALKTTTRQTVKDIEIIVIDGMNSTANQRVVTAAHDNRINYVGLEHDRGIQHARNVGCNMATGTYIAMLDDDDEWTSDKLEKQLKAFNDDSIALVACYTKIYTTTTSFVIEKIKTNPTYKDLLQSFNISPTSSFLLRRNLFKEIGYFNESIRGMHEHDVALRITKNGYTIVVVPEPLLIRLPHTGKSLERSYYHKIAETIDLWQYYGHDFIPYLGIRGFLLNVCKTLVLFFLFLMGYIIGDRVSPLVCSLESFYRQGRLSCDSL
jgi:glycosyltransferase involved in cell wall biosynthesis